MRKGKERERFKESEHDFVRSAGRKIGVEYLQ
jgi:hypothetical protein